MYRCNRCGTEFEEPATKQESRGEFWGTPAYEEFSICPCCKSDDFEEIVTKADVDKVDMDFSTAISILDELRIDEADDYCEGDTDTLELLKALDMAIEALEYVMEVNKNA